MVLQHGGSAAAARGAAAKRESLHLPDPEPQLLLRELRAEEREGAEVVDQPLVDDVSGAVVAPLRAGPAELLHALHVQGQPGVAREPPHDGEGHCDGDERAEGERAVLHTAEEAVLHLWGRVESRVTPTVRHLPEFDIR